MKVIVFFRLLIAYWQLAKKKILALRWIVFFSDFFQILGFFQSSEFCQSLALKKSNDMDLDFKDFLTRARFMS